MTKVDFYTGCGDKLKTACLLSHKAMQNGMRVLLHTPDQDTCRTLDKLLWHYPNTAFIPHSLSNHPEAENMSVLVDYSNESLPHCDILISLHLNCLPFFSRFERVIEIVGQEEDDIKQGRERYGFYRNRGYEMRHFDLKGRSI